MKKLFVIISLIVIFVQCKSDKKKPSQKISSRDYSINKSNAYNDLFLDSMDVVKFIEENHLPEDTARRMISFYNTRNYEFAWFSSAGLSEQAMGFASLLNLSNDTSKDIHKLQDRLNYYLGSTNTNLGATKSIKNDELLLTQNFIEYALDNFEKGYVKRKEMERFVPFKKVNALDEADSLLNKKHNDDKYFIDINEPYKLLMVQLTKYFTLAKGNSWKNIDVKLKLKKGASNPAIVDVKTNLFLAGDMSLDTTALFDDSLEAGIKHLQKRIGQTADGKLTPDVLNVLNISPEQMVKKILVNMNRMRWQPLKLPGRLLKVNIPAFVLHVYDDGEQVFQMPVIVGKEGHSTVLFSDKLTTIVFSPYWNVPESIVKNEIVPSMEKDKDYIERNNMEITGERNGLPVVRQKPGPKNSLGRVKFLFPNSFNIYFHDTPAKSLFSRDDRAYSHGCIRLGEPVKLAEWLLKDNSDWTDTKIREAMQRTEPESVKVKHPVSVMITYYTAWGDENGLNLRDDIYGHDEDVMRKMFL